MATAAPNLGVDFAAGRRRAAHGRSNTRAQRLRKGFRRRKRLKRLAAVVGGRALGIFTTGTLSGMIYGSEINGISDVELLKINRLAAVTMRPSARGRSLSMLMALHKSPTWRAGTAPVLQYVRAAWRAMAAAGDEDGADLTLPELRQALESLDLGRLIESRRGGVGTADGKRRRWDRVRGPAGALMLSLDRIGWHLSDPFTVVDDLGVSRKIIEHSPALWADLTRQAVTRGHERRVAAVWARRDPQFKERRVCIDHLLPQLATHRSRKRCRLDSLGAGIARAVVCDARLDRGQGQGRRFSGVGSVQTVWRS